jgi:hypothetical protein
MGEASAGHASTPRDTEVELSAEAEAEADVGE